MVWLKKIAPENPGWNAVDMILSQLKIVSKLGLILNPGSAMIKDNLTA